MRVIYIAPNRNWLVSYQGMVFGEDSHYEIYEWNEKEGWLFFDKHNTIKGCLMWLRANLIISGDEYRHQMSVLK